VESREAQNNLATEVVVTSKEKQEAFKEEDLAIKKFL